MRISMLDTPSIIGSISKRTRHPISNWFNQNDRMGYDTSQLYIEPKYGSLKEELFDNGIQAIKPSLYAQILQKAKIYIVSNMAKAIKAGDEEDDLHYGIKDGSAL
eukprot:397790_1